MYHPQTFSHVLRRSVGVLQAPSNDGTPPEQNPFRPILDQISPAGAFLILSTVFVAIAVLSSVRYTLLGVIATLAQVESPESNYVPLDVDQHHNKNSHSALLDEAGPDPEVVLVQGAPITSSIRRTLKYLTERAGYASRWRGLSCAVCTALAHGIVYQVAFNALSFVMPMALASLIAGVLTSIALARWYMAWTHVVISEPTTKRWFRRVPSFNTWRKIWAPTAINAFASQLALLLPAAAWFAFGFNDPERINGISAFSAIWKVITILLLALVAYVGIVIPCEVALTRCQASMLPEEDESIVAFDRSYGGKVVPAIIGGSGMLSYIDAWKSFDRAARLRIVKLYVKIFAIDVALHMLFGLVILVQLWLVLGSAMKKVQDGNQGQDGAIG